MANGFIWYELLTSAPDAAATFYGAVLGWTVADSGQAGMDYRIINMQGSAVGGLMALPPGTDRNRMQPCWLGYVSVVDVDASVAGFIAAGGAVHMPATEIEGVGRIAMVADPQGAAVYIMKPSGSSATTSFAPGKPGHGGWHELHARDWSSALQFYRAQFGWDKTTAMDMGPMGIYLMFNYGSGEAVGGMLSDAKAPRPHWLYYFNVENIDVARRRVVEHGGEALMEPQLVPTGTWVIHARDPQGAMFALVGPRR